VSQAVNIIQLQCSDKQPANESPFVKQPQRVTGTVEMVKSLSLEKINVLTNSPTQNNLEDDGLQYSEKKAPPRRTPSNVRKMISAFESVPPKVQLSLFRLSYFRLSNDISTNEAVWYSLWKQLMTCP